MNEPTNTPVNQASPERGGQLVNPRPVHRNTSIALDTREAKMKLFKASQSADVTVDTLGDRSFFAVDWMVHPKQMVDRDTGEVREAMRTVFWMEDGRTLEMFGVAIPECIANFEAVFGQAPWDPPQAFEIVSKPVGKNRTMHVLQPLD